MIDFRQTTQYADFMRAHGWKVRVIKWRVGKKLFAYIYPIPRTPLSVVQILAAPIDIPLDRVEYISQDERSICTRIDFIDSKHTAPFLSSLFAHGYHLTPWSVVPSKTRIIPLQYETADSLLRKMKQKTRYNIKLSIRRNVLVRFYTGSTLRTDCDPVHRFHEILCDSCRRTHLSVIPLDLIYDFAVYFGSRILLLLVYVGADVVAGGLFFLTKTTMYYTQNGSNAIGKDVHAPSLIIFEALKYATRIGLSYFDFDGIYDERNSKLESWKGFSKFKSGFGGYEYYHAPSYEKTSRTGITIRDRFHIWRFAKLQLPSIYPSSF